MTTSSEHCHCLVKLIGLGTLMESLGEESCRLLLDEFELRIRSVLRNNDRLVKVRQGKYCLMLNRVSERHHAELAAAKLERALAEPAQVLDRQVLLTFAIGMALPAGDASSKRLLQVAETALRQAHDDGCLSVVIDPTDAAHLAPVDVTLLPRLAQALEEGEFELYYQPKISTPYHSVVGAEALVRWHDSRSEQVVGPAQFIQAVESSPLIGPLTEHLLRSAIARCAGWAEPLSVAVNVAPVLLDTSGFISIVADALDFYAIKPERLVLEITERGELPGKALAHLEEIRKTGVRIAIDDFGTGQCSLSYFRDLPADELKIDMSFVQAMCSSKKDRAIVHSCIELAHDCGMQATAEGVEDEATAAVLADLGCDVLQGYYFGKPVPFFEFEQTHLSGLLATAEPDRFTSLLQGSR